MRNALLLVLLLATSALAQWSMPGSRARAPTAAFLRSGKARVSGRSAIDILNNVVRMDAYADCSGTSDATNAITNRVLVEGSGRTVFLPSGCTPLIRSPGDNLTNFTLPSGTSFYCEDNSAGFKLAAKRCVGGTYNGAACTNDPNCIGGGACRIDGGLATVYAPTGGATYGLFTAAAASTKNGIFNCSFFTQGMDPGWTCVGGTNAGQPCRNTCAGGAQSGRLCLTDVDCPGSTCTLDTVCAGGTCSGTAGTPSGPGKTNLIDFSNVVQAGDIEGITVWDLRQADFAIKAGPQQLVQRVVIPDYTGNWSTLSPPGHPSSLPPPTTITAWTPAAQNVGSIVIAGVGTNVANGFIRCGTGSCVTINLTNADVEHMQITASNGGTGITHNASAGMILSNIINCDNTAGTVGVDDIPDLSSRSPGVNGGNDSLISANTIETCFIGVRIAGIGITMLGNTVLFSNTANIQFGSNATYGGLPGHSAAIANFIGNLGAQVGIQAVNPGNRCQDGTRQGETCTTNDCQASTGCPGSAGCPTSCSPAVCCQLVTSGSAPANIAIERNNFIGNTGPAFDLSAWKSSGGVAEMSSVLVSDNFCMANAAGVAFTGTCIGMPTDPNEATQIQLKDNLTAGMATAYTGGLTYAKGRTVHQLCWNVSGTPTAATRFAQRLTVPPGTNSCQAVDSRIVVNTTSTAASTYNVQRCTANCTLSSPTFTSLYTSNVQLDPNTQTMAGGIPTGTCTATNVPWACCDGTSGGTGGCGTTSPLKSLDPNSQYAVIFPTVGASLADPTVCLFYACDN